MGEWNGTCGVSGLPIRCGDKIRVFVLTKKDIPPRNPDRDYNAEGGGTCYSDGVWAPYAPPLKGTYDCYGGIEDIEKTEEVQNLLDRLKVDMTVVEDEYSSDNVPVLDMNIEQAMRYIERDRAKKESLAEHTFFGLFMVLEEVYQTMIDYNPIEAFFSRNREFKDRYYYYMPKRDIIRKDLTSFYEKASADIQKEIKVQMNEARDKASAKMIAVSLAMMESGDIFTHRNSMMQDLKFRFMKLLSAEVPLNSPEATKLIDTSMECIMFYYAMEEARRLWHPPCGKGSQDRELGLQEKINNTVKKIIKKSKQKDIDNGAEVPNAQGYYSYQVEHNEKIVREHGIQEVK